MVSAPRWNLFDNFFITQKEQLSNFQGLEQLSAVLMTSSNFSISGQFWEKYKFREHTT